MFAARKGNQAMFCKLRKSESGAKVYNMLQFYYGHYLYCGNPYFTNIKKKFKSNTIHGG